MDLSKKLQVPTGTAIFVVDLPEGLGKGLRVTKREEGAAVLVFAANYKKLAENAGAAVAAARADRLSWIAYPKGGQLKTDLNRDKLQGLVKHFGIEGVRLVSIDNVWSAMRFRPLKSS